MAKVHDSATDLITFARSSSGTALRRIGYGENLVDNGEFETDILNWSAVGGGASVAWDSGPQRMQVTAGAGFEGALQTLSLTSGKVYVLSCDYVRGSVSQVRLAAQGFSGQPAATGTAASGSLEVIAVAGVTNNVRVDAGGSTGDFYVDNISVKEVIFDRATDPLVLFSHPDDIPRIEYGSDGSLKGLLIEEQRANLLTHSTPDAVTPTNWGALSGSGTRTLTTLSNGLSALRFQATSERPYIQQAVTLNANTTYTLSVYVEAGYTAGARPVLLISNLGGTTGTTQASLGSEDSNGRISVNFTTGSDVSGFIRYGLGTDTNDTGDVTLGGMQLEQGSFATSYIPTSGSQQTRSADVASIPVSAFGYNQDAGTVVVEAQVADTSVSNAGDLRIKTATGSVITNSGSRVGGFPAGSYVVYSPTTNILMRVDTVLGDGQPYKAAYSIAESNSAISVNGSSVVIDQTTTLAGNTVSLFELGNNFGFLNGHIKSLKYFPRRLTNTQLQELTA